MASSFVSLVFLVSLVSFDSTFSSLFSTFGSTFGSDFVAYLGFSEISFLSTFFSGDLAGLLSFFFVSKDASGFFSFFKDSCFSSSFLGSVLFGYSSVFLPSLFGLIKSAIDFFASLITYFSDFLGFFAYFLLVSICFLSASCF